MPGILPIDASVVPMHRRFNRRSGSADRTVNMPAGVTDGLFTVIMEFDGTTAAAQIRARDCDAALNGWLKALDTDGAYGLTKAQRVSLKAAYRPGVDGTPVQISGLGNVWCLTVSVNGRLALLHLVRTVEFIKAVRPDGER